MKAALCFIISYDHQLNKEQIWREWIEPNKDIINVYFHYKTFDSIKSEWIKERALPKKFLAQTDYLHIVPAYLTLMSYALSHDRFNQWFCFLTDSCAPIISPLKFRELFLENYAHSFMSWREAWWNTSLVKRANLHYLQPQFRLANSPWFILNRGDAYRCLLYPQKNKEIYDLICKGEVANESIFAIMLYAQNSLKLVKNEDATATDWTRMMSSTSPYLFKEGDCKDKKFIDDYLKEKKYTMFLRKVDKSFPDSLLIEYINGKEDSSIVSKRKSRVIQLYYRMLSVKYYYVLSYYFRTLFKDFFYVFLFLGFIYFMNIYKFF